MNVERSDMLPGGSNAIGASKPISVDTLEELKQEYLLNGFLYFPKFLSQDKIDYFIDVMYRLDKTQPYSIQKKSRKPGDPYEVRNALACAPELLELIDLEPVLMLVSYLMGYNIQICNTQAFIKPGFPPGTTMEQQGSFGWHTDMQRNAEAINGVLPRFTTRAGFFLTDLSQPNMGSVKIVPSSHRYAGKPPWNSATNEPYGMLELTMEAGSLLILDNRVWHSQCLNYSPKPRINIYTEYSWRWMRPIDHDVYGDDLLKGADPVRRQLLGCTVTDVNEGFFPFTLPGDSDVPLKAWLAERGLDLPQVVGNVPIGDL
jgi:ectoine hydroxylase